MSEQRDPPLDKTSGGGAVALPLAAAGSRSRPVISSGDVAPRRETAEKNASERVVAGPSFAFAGSFRNRLRITHNHIP